MEDNTPQQQGGVPPAGQPPYSASPPPPIIRQSQPAPAPARKTGNAWKVMALVLLALLLVSAFYNLASFATTFMSGPGPYRVSVTAGPKIDEVLTEDNSSADKVAIVKVEGIITSDPIQGGYSMVEIIKAQLETAKEDQRVKAVILKVDSPGGEVLASDEIYRLISDFQKSSKKPVVASMGNLAASGGYYVSAPCRWIVANELTITGSIGVIMSTWNYRALMDKVGVQPFVYKSGKFKDMLSGSRELTEIPAEERAMVESLVSETFSRFKDVVQLGREAAFQYNQKGKAKNRKLAEDWADYADGRVFSGVEAFRIGFVDELGNFQDAVSRANSLAGVAKANLIEYRQRYDFSDFFRLFGKSEQPVIKIDFGVEGPKLRPGLPYFLYSVQH
jgi:protease IV